MAPSPLAAGGTRHGYAEGPEDSAAAHGRAHHRSRRGGPLPGRGRAATPPRSTRRRAASTARCCSPSACSAVVLLLIDHLPGPLRPGAAQAHLRGPGGDPLRHGRAAGRRFPGRDRAARARDQRADRRQPRDRRARAHPCRQSRARAQDAALGDGERGRRRAAAIRLPPRCASRPTSCAIRSPAISSARGSPPASP